MCTSTVPPKATADTIIDTRLVQLVQLFSTNGLVGKSETAEVIINFVPIPDGKRKKKTTVALETLTMVTRIHGKK